MGKFWSRGRKCKLCKVSFGDLMYKNLMIVNNTVLYT